MMFKADVSFCLFGSALQPMTMVAKIIKERSSLFILDGAKTCKVKKEMGVVNNKLMFC
jgi:hypothetical protein